jgi:uncharacterized protein (DUF2249 family)
MQTYASIIHVPDFPPREKHSTIFKGFDELKSENLCKLLTIMIQDHFSINL